MKKLNKLFPLIPVFTVLTPFLVFGATAGQGLENLITTLKNIVSSVIPLFMILAVAVFLWGIVRYVTAGGDETKEKAARGYIIYGLIGLFVLVSFWGIITLFSTTFGTDTTTPPPGFKIDYSKI